MSTVAHATSIPEPGWYPDPTARHQYRYWGGEEWTAHCADDGQTCLDSLPGGSAAAKRPFPLRRVLWCIYAVPLTAFGVVSFFGEVDSLGFVGVIDVLATAMSLVVLQLHIWDKPVLQPSVWKAFAVGFIAWDLAFNLFLEPAVSGTAFDPWALVAPVVLIPLYVALFRYAFRSWASGDGDVALTGAST